MAPGLRSAVLHKQHFVVAVYILQSDIHAAALFRRGSAMVTRCAAACSDGWINFSPTSTVNAAASASCLDSRLAICEQSE